MPLGAARICFLAKGAAVVVEAGVIRLKKGITAIGNAQVDTAQSKFGGSSALFDGTGDYLDITGAIDFGTGNFTVEFWVYPDVLTSTRLLFDGRVSGTEVIPVLYTSGTDLYYYVTANRITATSSLTTGTWQHIAVSRSSGTTKLFVNGTQVGSSYSDSNNYVSFNPYIGIYKPDSTSPYDGNIDELRVSNTARYTANFTAPTSPFVNDENTVLLLHMDGTDASTVFEDDNGVREKKGVRAVNQAQVDTAQSKFGGSSMLLDGTGDYLLARQSSDFLFGAESNSFTIEFFMRSASFSAIQCPISNRSGGTGPSKWWCEITTAAKMYWAFYNSANSVAYVNLALAGSAFSTNTWYHIALVNNAGTARLYVDGTQVGADATFSGTYGSSTLPIYVGGLAGSFNFNGHLDEVRISNTARYTGNFTAPTAPFVNDDNTLLLIHADGTDSSTYFEDDNGVRAKVGVTAIGNAQIDTAQSKFGGASALFDGTGDYLTSPTSSNLILPVNEDFTIEGWIRPSATTGIQVIATDRNGNLSGFTFDISMWSGSYLVTRTATLLFESASGAGSIIVISDNNVFTTNTWHHFAVVRSSNEIYLYVDGVDVTNNRAGTRSARVGTGNLSIGMNPGDAVNTFAGHIDEFRWSNTARYTTGFTPSTTPFQNDSNTLLLLHMDGTDGSTVFTDDNGVPPDYEY